jgi:hypothetical protein
MRLINFHLSFSWSQDILREIMGNLEDGELKDLVDEMIPIGKEFNHNYTTILSEEDMKAAGLHHDQPLLKRFKDKTLLRNNQG